MRQRLLPCGTEYTKDLFYIHQYPIPKYIDSVTTDPSPNPGNRYVYSTQFLKNTLESKHIDIVLISGGEWWC